jgi:hypothetical protein
MFNDTPESTIASGERSKPLFILATAAVSLIALIWSLSFSNIKLAVGFVTAWTVLIWILIACIKRCFDRIVMAWLIAFPFCYYLFSFPRERPIFTVDRALLLLVFVALVSAFRYRQLPPLPIEVRIAAYLWVGYLFVCLISLWAHPVPHVLDFYRLVVEALLMPALLGIYAISVFPIARNLTKIHACLCILMIGIALVAGIELLTGTNLLPANGAVETWVQTSDVKLIRVDGPFENSSVLCVVGTLGFFLITYCKHLMVGSPRGSGRMLHYAGILASLAAALLPMNRGLVIALLVCACIDYFAPDPLVSRGTWNWIFAVLLLVALVGTVFYPGVFEDRVTSGDNLYQRVAQNVQALEVVRDHPLMGVGFNLYHDTVIGDPRYAVRWGGFEAMDVAHNSLLAVLADDGCIGFLLYVTAQLFLLRAMWMLRRINGLGWRVFLYSILVYTIFGLDAAIAYYSDLNLFYMFVLGTILQIQLRMRDAQLSPPNVFC